MGAGVFNFRGGGGASLSESLSRSSFLGLGFRGLGCRGLRFLGLSGFRVRATPDLMDTELLDRKTHKPQKTPKRTCIAYYMKQQGCSTYSAGPLTNQVASRPGCGLVFRTSPTSWDSNVTPPSDTSHRESAVSIAVQTPAAGVATLAPLKPVI